MFVCNFCQESFAVIGQYNRHQLLHRNVKGFKVACLYSNCITQCTSYSSFRQHIARYHNNVKDGFYFCKHKNCDSSFFNFKLLKEHVSTHAKKSSNDTYVCGFCQTRTLEFKTLNAYKIHISRYHNLSRDIDATLRKTKCSTDCTNNEKNDEIFYEYAGATKENEIFTNGSTSDHNTINISKSDNHNSNVESIFSKLYVRLSAKHLATEPLIQNVVDSISEGYACSSQKFKLLLQNSELSLKDQTIVEQLLAQSFSDIHDTHKTDGVFSTSFRRNTHAKQSEMYIQPIKIHFKNKNGSNTEYYYSYVPPLETLRVMFKDEKLYEICFLPSESAKNREGLFDITDGTVIQNNQFFKDNPRALKIILFQDGFEICNPIGTSRKKFSMIGLYMMLGNLPPHLRSKSENIKLVFLCREKLVRDFTWKQVLHNVLMDLSYLETVGIDITYKETNVNIKGTLIAMAGDNLGSHQVGGFVENFSSTPYSSRYCETTMKDFRENPFKKNPLRTVESYNENANKAVNTKKLVKGIKLHSLLNSLLYYHVCNPGLPPCTAHDILEGIAPCDLWLAIKYFIKIKKWFRIGQLNYRLNDLKVKSLTRIAIPQIQIDNNKKKKLVGSASQIRYLILIFPLAVADFIKDFDDDVWQMVLQLRRICSIVFAPWLSHFQVESLRDEWHDYVTTRVTVFPNEPLKPKHLFTKHYPDLILNFGPLKHLWTLRFETQHQYYKKVVKHMQNFKSITQTLSEKHELLHSTQRNTYDDFVEIYNCVSYDSQKFDFHTNTLIADLSRDMHESIAYVCEKVLYRGITYSVGMALCVQGLPYFGHYVICHINNILVDSNRSQVYFIGFIDEIVYHPSVGVYELIAEQSFYKKKMMLYPYSSLLSFDPLPESHIQQVKVYLPKYVPYSEDF